MITVIEGNASFMVNDGTLLHVKPKGMFAIDTLTIQEDYGQKAIRVTQAGTSIILFEEDWDAVQFIPAPAVAPVDKLATVDLLRQYLFDIVSPNTWITGVPGGVMNGINTVFTTADTFDPTTLEIYYRGLLMQVVTDYAINSGNNGFATTFTPDSAANGGWFYIRYRLP